MRSWTPASSSAAPMGSTSAPEPCSSCLVPRCRASFHQAAGPLIAIPASRKHPVNPGSIPGAVVRCSARGPACRLTSASEVCKLLDDRLNRIRVMGGAGRRCAGPARLITPIFMQFSLSHIATARSVLCQEVRRRSQLPPSQSAQVQSLARPSLRRRFTTTEP
jgi:hypothetical protein